MAQKFLTNVELEAGLVDGSNSTGTSGFLLSSTGTATSWVDPAAVSVGESEQVHIACKNTSGVAISKGDPVYITGTVGTSFRIQIAAADASNSAKMPAVGLAETDLGINAEGFVIVSGVLKNLTTDPLSTSDGTPSSNDTVYVKAGGGLTKTKPTGSGNLIQNVGKVGRVNSASAGSLAVSTIMRTNDVPNLTTGKIWVGSSTYTTESTVVHLDEANGRMGIGTTSPGQPLHVNGNARVDGDFFIIESNPQIFLSDTNHNSDFSINLNSGLFKITDTTNSADRITLDSSGNVGIGTTSPSHPLTIVSSYPQIKIQQTGQTPSFTFGSGSGYAVFDGIGTSGSLLDIRDDGTSRMRIDASGNVGIGTSSPGAKLDVAVGDIRLGTNATYFRVRDTASAQPRVLGMNASNTTYVGPIDSYAGGGIVYGASGNVAYHGFYGGGSEKVRITSGGDVGIGTTSPSAKLDSISADGNTNSLRLGRSDNSNYWDFNHAGNDLRIFNTAGSGSDVLIGPNSGGTDQGNRLAIGTATPTQRLHVSGNARVTGAYYDSNNSAGTSGQVLSSTGTGTDWIDAASGGGIDGSGSTNYVAKWSDSDTITNSILFDTGTNVGVSITSPSFKLDVGGTLRAGSLV